MIQVTFELKPYIHRDLRKHQKETLDQIRASTEPITVMEAPTGSGKTFHPAQLAYEGTKVLTLVKAKSLQGQYTEPPYNAKKVMGKGNYSCRYGLVPDASLCKMSTKERQNTGCHDNCPYYVACQHFMDSSLGSLNYAKYLLETRRNGLVPAFNPQVLFLDECHQLSDIVIDWSGCTLAWTPFLTQYIQPLELNPMLPSAIRVNRAVDWLTDLLASLMRQEPAKITKSSTQDQIKHYKRWENLVRKVGNTTDLIDEGREYWFAESNHDKGFRLKPLTARFHFKYLFTVPKIVLMSATIGNVAPFMAELGIYEDYQSIVVPDIWPPHTRPIVDLQAPSYRNKMTEAERQEHARIIARALDDYPSNWNGLIHAQGSAMPGTKMVHDLARRLQKLTKRPLWLPSFDNQGTEQALQSWLQFEQRNKGAVAITHQFYEGVDLPNLNINITARVPYPDFGDTYEKERFEFGKEAAQVRVANIIRQEQGRNRRGYAEHYGPNAEKFNAIADGKWIRLKWALGNNFVEAVI